MINSNYSKTLICITLIATLGLPLTVIANSDPAPGDAAPQSAQDDNAVIYLGNIQVRGEKNIVKTLQAIKVGLQMPYSSDPKLADVVVCRIEDQAGSHIKKWLTCETNRNAANRREALNTSMDTSIAQNYGGMGCESLSCYSQVFEALTETLNSQPGHTLHTSVNGPALHQLLEKIPYPQGYTPAPTSTTAPAAPTHD
ncbi:MAG TPA: hypothetical protein VNF48_04105 [Gammaproteobacteria bacterium]|nr:hypothetical protein [Gammaproteobacteria bacterium]